MTSKKVIEKLEFAKILEFVANYSITEAGKETVLNITPLGSKEEAIYEGKLVSEAKEVLIHNDIPPINYLPDLHNVLAKTRIQGATAQKKDILEIQKLARSSRVLFTFFKNNQHAPSIVELTKDLFVDKVFEHHFERIFTDNGDIRDNASQKLSMIRKEINEKNELLRKVVNRILKQYSEAYLVQEEYITLREGRIVLPVKAEHKRHVKGFIHSESGTGQTVYIEPEETLELNNEILSLKFAEKREIDKILKDLTQKIAGVSRELEESLNIITKLDLIFAKARYSTEIIGSFPTLEDDEDINLLNARHPILLKKFGRNGTVPLNLQMGKNNVILITGPNAGGKTVVLKTFGLINLMAACGLHIPADPDTNLHLFKNIMLDVGDEQSIENDLSTFSSHLNNIKNILNDAGKDTLVLIDEIGTGTDPTEGAAIATAVLVELQKKGTAVLATTHHGSLKLIADELDGFQNASMEFDNEKLSPTYVFSQGLPGSSYAFEIARRIGFDESFIKFAEKYLDGDKYKVEKFLIDLETKSRTYKQKLDETERENVRLKGLANLYKDKIDNLEKQKKEILSEAKNKADAYLKDVNKRIEQAIKTIRESSAEKSVVKEQRREIENLRKDIRKEKTEQVEVLPDEELEAGSYAKVKGTETSGVIKEIDKNKNRAFLEVGSLKIQVKYSDLIPAKNKEVVETSYVSHQYSPSYYASQRLDIRGEKPEDAEYKILRFLDDAYASNLDKVEIIHGKGTGTLKSTVHEILKNYDKVKDFYFANIEVGGEGLTIVEFV